MQPELLLEARALLGEGPSWDAAAGRLYWVDIYAGVLHVFDPGERTDRGLDVGAPLGCVVPCRLGTVALAGRGGFATFDLRDGSRASLADPEVDLPGNRFNDGKCDPAGRFLAGTMDNAEKEATGSLYSLSTEGRVKKLLDGARISNGLAWSPDHATLYYIDTPTRLVMAYDYDVDQGEISRPRPVIDVPESMGWPDGMTSDLDGNLWVALWGGARLSCWDPLTGRLIREIPFAALNVTSCVFGGENLTDLYVTSARKGMTEEQLAAYPHSGGLFRIRTDIRGMPTFAFGGK